MCYFAVVWLIKLVHGLEHLPQHQQAANGNQPRQHKLDPSWQPPHLQQEQEQEQEQQEACKQAQSAHGKERDGRGISQKGKWRVGTVSATTPSRKSLHPPTEMSVVVVGMDARTGRQELRAQGEGEQQQHGVQLTLSTYGDMLHDAERVRKTHTYAYIHTHQTLLAGLSSLPSRTSFFFCVCVCVHVFAALVFIGAE